jgi:SAM-dependent methyltransferase
VLVIPQSGPGGADWTIVECPACQSRFSTDRRGADYSPEAVPGGLLFDLYLDQGAGLRPMLDPLGWAEMSPGRRMLEIGGGFGFASDYVQTVLGWSAKGYDPSGLALMGRDYLGLDIVPDYWTDDTPLPQPFDVAYASEVIEHIPEPLGFLRSVRRAVGEKGVAILTTPDGAALNPGTSPAMLAPIATPGQHLTLFSAGGLEQALRAVGFKNVHVVVQGTTLQAYAGDSDLPVPCPLDEGRYQAYLRRRMETPGLAPTLLSGLRYRLFKELVNQGESAAALELFEQMRSDISHRFGFDMGDAAGLQPPEPLTDALQWLARYPGSLTGLLYLRAILANNVEGDAAAAARFTAAAALLGTGLRKALQGVGMEDGETEMFTSAALRLHLIAAVSAGADTVPLLAALEQGMPDRGLQIPARDRAGFRRGLRRDLRMMGHPEALWRTAQHVGPAVDEVELLERTLRQGLPITRITAMNDIADSADSAAVMETLWRIWTLPGAGEAPDTIRHARKVALIRLVQLGAFQQADALFEAWDAPELAADPSVATALGIIAQACPR